MRLYQTSLLSKHSFVLCSQEPNSDRLPRPLQPHCYNRITIFKAQKAITSCDLLGARVLQYRSHTGTTSSYVKHISNTIYYQVTQNLPTLILAYYLDHNTFVKNIHITDTLLSEFQLTRRRVILSRAHNSDRPTFNSIIGDIKLFYTIPTHLIAQQL